MKKLLGILVLSLFFSSSAYAEWTRISKTSMGDTYYVDFENIKIEGKLIYHWELMDYGKPSKNGDLSHKIFLILDCNTYSTKPLQFIFYKGRKGSGKFDSQKSVINEWEPLPPDAVGFIAAKKFCKNI